MVHLRLGLPSSLLPSNLPTKTLCATVRTPYVPHAQPILFLLILLPEEYLVSSTDHKAARYAVFSIPPSPRPS